MNPFTFLPNNELLFEAVVLQCSSHTTVVFGNRVTECITTAVLKNLQI